MIDDFLKNDKLKKKKYLKTNLTIESFKLHYISQPMKKIFIVLNNKVIKAKIINCLMRLRELRLLINIKINYIFTFNGREIEYDSELNIILKDIIEEYNLITLKEKECDIKISIDNFSNSYIIKYLTTETLFNLRKKLGIKNKYKFIKNNNFILLSHEKFYKIQEILINKNEILLKQDTPLENNFSKTENNLIQADYILKLDKTVYKIKLNNDILLNEIRDTINFHDIKKYYFLNSKGEIIPKEDEDKYTIKSISYKKNNISTASLTQKNCPIQESKFIKVENNLKIYKYPKIEFNYDQLQECKYLIVIGETGCGKTTLLNCLINFLMGIKQDDDFRYIIIDEKDNKNKEDSHTLNINSYYILPANKDIPPIKIVDTPGFGDTREFFDSEVLEKFQNFLEKEMSILLICFVMKSTTNRNTEFQKYVINNILGLFGKDIISNFVLLFTFCDGGKPLFINSLTSNENPFSKIISNISDPWYISFNNSAIFSDKENFRNVYWNICYDGFSKLLFKLENIEKKNLNLTKKVIRFRKEILNKAYSLNIILDDCLEAENTLNYLIINFEEKFKKLKEYKNFKSIITIENKKKVETDCGIHNINCLKCQKTCHKFCQEIQNGEISKCKNVINSFCKICKCHYNEHFDQPYYFSGDSKDKEMINLKIYNNYINSQIEIAKIVSLIELKLKELKNYEKEANICVKNIQNDFENLNKISLYSNIYKTQEKFLEYKIIIENSSKEKGYFKKVIMYEKYKKTFNRLNNIYENNNIFNELDEFHQKFNIKNNKLSESVKNIIIDNN